ncbi:hypothetical protein V9T40_005748 [Parthenolecanium corni]|uniref:Uncharacterized protein n=1 Tax=Parthenolecanium corni TaxID=536013 RepID=A0AAN9YB14_9HEMI
MRTRAKETAIEKPVELMEMAEAVLIQYRYLLITIAPTQSSINREQPLETPTSVPAIEEDLIAVTAMLKVNDLVLSATSTGC